MAETLNGAVMARGRAEGAWRVALPPMPEARLMRDALGPVLVVDGAGRLLLISPAAAPLVAPSGLRLKAGLLEHRQPTTARALQALVRRTAEGGPGGAVLLAAEVEAGRLVARVTPLPGQDTHPVLIAIRHPGASPPPAEVPRAAFGLGRAEAEVAILMAQGLSAEAAAARRGTSVATVRAQVRALLGKSGAASLRELALLIHALG